MANFTEKQIELLKQNLEASKIKTRTEGKGDKAIVLSYIEGYEAIYEANNIFGFDGWSYEIIECREIVNRLYKNSSNYERVEVGYYAKVRVNAGGIFREGVGTGSGIASPLNLYKAMENAIKESETDALKRALRSFGSKFGLALYDKYKTNVVDYKQLTTDELDELYSIIEEDFKKSESVDDLRAKWLNQKQNIASIRNNSENIYSKVEKLKDTIKLEFEKKDNSYEEEDKLTIITKLMANAKTAQELDEIALKHESEVSKFKKDDQDILKKQYQFCLNKLNGVEENE